MYEIIRDQQKRENLESHKWRVAHIQEKLQAPDYRSDQEASTEDRNGVRSGSWVFQHPVFEKWTEAVNTEHGILYVNGIPGAGKSCLVSNQNTMG